MIIAGGFRTHVLTQHAPDLTCDACGQADAIDLHVYSKCLHLFFVPILPLTKVGHSTCSHCGAELRDNEMPAEMQQSFSAAKASATAPWWQFSGAAIFVALMLLLPVVSKLVNNFEPEPVPLEDFEAAAGEAPFDRHGPAEMVDREERDSSDSKEWPDSDSDEDY